MQVNMRLREAIATIEQYIQWRENEAPAPKQKDVTQALQIAVECMRAQSKGERYGEAEKMLQTIKDYINGR